MPAVDAVEAPPQPPEVPYPKAVQMFPRLRQSLLGRFDNCGLTVAFDLRWGQGDARFTSHDAARGQVFHRIAAACIEEMAALGEDRIEVSVALAIYEEKLRQHDVDERCPACDGLQDPVGGGYFLCQDCGRRGMTQMTALPANHVKDLRISTIKWANDQAGAKGNGGGFAIGDLVSVEERLYAKISYPSQYGPVERLLTGQTDAMFFRAGRMIVPDWKDTWGLPPEAELSFGGYFQQRMYAYLIFANYPSVQTVELREVYHRLNEVRRAVIVREDLQNIRAELAALVERFDRAVEQDLWRPSPGKHCAFCLAPQHCPIPSLARGEGGISDEAEAHQVAAELAVAEVVAKRHRGALRAYMNRTGKPVSVADPKARKAYGLRSQTVTIKPDQEAIEREVRMAESEGRTPDIKKLYRTRTQTKMELMVPPDVGQPDPEDTRLAEALRASLDQINATKMKGKGKS